MEGSEPDVPSGSGPTKYCDYTDLPVEQCAHCQEETVGLRKRRKGFSAQFTGGICHICGEMIIQRDLIVSSEEGWVHEECQ